MEEHQNEKSSENAWREQVTHFIGTFSVVAAAILFYYLIQYLGNISNFIKTILHGISPVIWGLVLAYLLEPIAIFWERNLREWRLPKSQARPKTEKTLHVVSAILMVITAFILIALLLLLIVPEVTNSITGIIKELPSQMENLSDSLKNKTFFDNSTALGAYANTAVLSALQSAEKWLMSDLPSQAETIISYFYTGVKNVFSVVYNLVVGLILAMYITIDKEKLQRQVKKLTYSIFSKETAFKLRRAVGRGNQKFSAAIRGKMVDSLIIGLISFTLLTLINILPWLNFPYPVLLAVITGVTNVVPFFGPIVGGFINFVLVLFDNPKMALPYLILIVIIQQFDANYLDPRMVGGSIGLRPFWSITAVLLGSSILGVPGYIIGPPVVAFIYEIVREWTHDKIREKNMAEEFGLPPEDDENPFADFSYNNDPYGIQKQNEIEKHFKEFLKHTRSEIAGFFHRKKQKKKQKKSP